MVSSSPLSCRASTSVPPPTHSSPMNTRGTCIKTRGQTVTGCYCLFSGNHQYNISDTADSPVWSQYDDAEIHWTGHIKVTWHDRSYVHLLQYSRVQCCTGVHPLSSCMTGLMEFVYQDSLYPTWHHWRLVGGGLYCRTAPGGDHDVFISAVSISSHPGRFTFRLYMSVILQCEICFCMMFSFLCFVHQQPIIIYS